MAYSYNNSPASQFPPTYNTQWYLRPTEAEQQTITWYNNVERTSQRAALTEENMRRLYEQLVQTAIPNNFYRRYVEGCFQEGVAPGPWMDTGESIYKREPSKKKEPKSFNELLKERNK